MNFDLQSWVSLFWLFSSYLVPFVSVSSCWLWSSLVHCEGQVHTVYQRFLKGWQRPTPQDISGYLACLYQFCTDYKLEEIWWIKVNTTMQCSFWLLMSGLPFKTFLATSSTGVLCLESAPWEHRLRLTNCKESENDAVPMQPWGLYKKCAYSGCWKYP